MFYIIELAISLNWPFLMQFLVWFRSYTKYWFLHVPVDVQKYRLRVSIELGYFLLRNVWFGSVDTLNTGFSMALWLCKNTGSAYLLNLAGFLICNF